MNNCSGITFIAVFVLLKGRVSSLSVYRYPSLSNHLKCLLSMVWTLLSFFLLKWPMLSSANQNYPHRQLPTYAFIYYIFCCYFINIQYTFYMYIFTSIVLSCIYTSTYMQKKNCKSHDCVRYFSIEFGLQSVISLYTDAGVIELCLRYSEPWHWTELWRHSIHATDYTGSHNVEHGSLLALLSCLIDCS